MSTPGDNAEISASALSKEELIAALDIDLNLCDEEAGDNGLIHSYSRWKAIKAAYRKMQDMSWNGPKPVIVSTISHLFHFIYNLFRTYATRFIICYCLYLHVSNPESEYGASQLLTSDSR